MKPEEKELHAMHQEIEDELAENKFISRKMTGVKDDTLTIRIPSKRKIEEAVPKKKVTKKKKNDPVPAEKETVPVKKKKMVKKKKTTTTEKNDSDLPKKKPVKKKKKTNPNPEKEEIEPMVVEEDLSLLVDLLDESDDDDEKPDLWNNMEVPWNLSYDEREQRYKNESQSIQDLSLEQRMTRYLELVVLGKGGRKIDTTKKDRAVVDFFIIERSKIGDMIGTYADEKIGEIRVMCDYIETLGSKILDFEARPNGAQEDCYFTKEKLKKADAWVCTITMEDNKENGEKVISKSKKYVHKKLVPILQAALFIIGFDVSIAGQIEDFVGELEPTLTLDEKAKAVGESDMGDEFITGLKYSMKLVAEAAEWMEGFIDECWKL